MSSTYSGYSNEQLLKALTSCHREIQDLRAKNAELEAQCVAIKQAWELGRARVHTNFSHVSEAIRACDWIEATMHKALRPTAGRDLLENLETANHTFDPPYTTEQLDYFNRGVEHAIGMIEAAKRGDL